MASQRGAQPHHQQRCHRPRVRSPGARVLDGLRTARNIAQGSVYATVGARCSPLPSSWRAPAADDEHCRRSYHVDVGAGSGKFAFHLAVAFRELRRQGGLWTHALAGRQVVVVLTDFCEANVAAWSQQPQLSALAADGAIDWALWDASGSSGMEAASTLYLRQSKVRCSTAPASYCAPSHRVHGPQTQLSTVDNPVCASCNYLFDTLRHDAFQVHGTAIHLCLLP